MTIQYLHLTNEPDPSYDVFHDNQRERSPRIYYRAQASNGRVALRGSWRDVYSHAVVQVCDEQFQDELISWATYHSSEQLAKRRLTYLTNAYSKKYGDDTYSFELIKLEKITAKEFRKYKALQKKGLNKYAELRRQQLIDHTGINPDTEGGN